MAIVCHLRHLRCCLFVVPYGGGGMRQYGAPTGRVFGISAVEESKSSHCFQIECMYLTIYMVGSLRRPISYLFVLFVLLYGDHAA